MDADDMVSEGSTKKYTKLKGTLMHIEYLWRLSVFIITIKHVIELLIIDYLTTHDACKTTQ